MKKYTIIFAILLFFFSCKQNIKLIPEITQSIAEENIYNINDLNILKNIIKKDSDIVYLTSMGKITRFNPEKRKINFLFLMNAKIEPEFFTQNELVILKKYHSDNRIVFDLNEMKIKKTLQKIENIIGINKRILVYKNKDELVIFDYLSQTILKKIKTDGSDINNCEFQNDKIFILSNSKIYIYNQSKNSHHFLNLKNNAASKFLLDDQYIYYGSNKREFIKFSIKSNKVKWEYKIPKILKIKPQKAGELITILPEDNNIYFFKKSGTLYWWNKLESTRLIPPIIMKNNVCVFLMPKSKPNLKFFNYKEKKVYSYQIKHQKKSNPIYINDFLYILSKEKNKEHQSITKIGNKYDITVEIDPKTIKPIGKSITFDLTPINLIDPEFKIKIRNESKKDVYTTKINKADHPSFLWIPSEAGEYTLIVETDAQNKRDLKFSQTFKVVDIEQILKKYFFNIQKKCKIGLFN